jgi:hypothetical protein
MLELCGVNHAFMPLEVIAILMVTPVAICFTTESVIHSVLKRLKSTLANLESVAIELDREEYRAFEISEPLLIACREDIKIAQEILNGILKDPIPEIRRDV